MSRQSNPFKVQEWTERFLRFGNASQTVMEFCRNEGVSQPSFYQWRKKHKSAEPVKAELPARRLPRRMC